MKAETIKKRDSLVGTFVMSVAKAASGQKLTSEQNNEVGASMRTLISDFGYDRETHGVIISQLDDLSAERPALTLSVIESVMAVAAKRDGAISPQSRLKSQNRESLESALALVWRNIMLNNDGLAEDYKLNRAREMGRAAATTSVRLSHEANSVLHVLRRRTMDETSLSA